MKQRFILLGMVALGLSMSAFLGGCASSQGYTASPSHGSSRAYSSHRTQQAKNTNSDSPAYGSREDWIYDRGDLPQKDESSHASSDNRSNKPNASSNASTSENMQRYVVRPGDSLWKIAHLYKTTVDRIREINHLTSSYILQPGKVLLIPRS